MWGILTELDGTPPLHHPRHNHFNFLLTWGGACYSGVVVGERGWVGNQDWWKSVLLKEGKMYIYIHIDINNRNCLIIRQFELLIYFRCIHVCYILFFIADIPWVRGGSNLKPGGCGFVTQRATLSSAFPSMVKDAMRASNSSTGWKWSTETPFSQLVVFRKQKG